MLERAARATCDFYMHQASARDGICYWDTGAPELPRWATGRRSRGSVQRLRAGGLLGERDCRAGADPAGARAGRELATLTCRRD